VLCKFQILKNPLSLWASPPPWFMCTTSEILWHSSKMSLLQLPPPHPLPHCCSSHPVCTLHTCVHCQICKWLHNPPPSNGVARTSARRKGHPARAFSGYQKLFLFERKGLLPSPPWGFTIRVLSNQTKLYFSGFIQ